MTNGLNHSEQVGVLVKHLVQTTPHRHPHGLPSRQLLYRTMCGSQAPNAVSVFLFWLLSLPGALRCQWFVFCTAPEPVPSSRPLPPFRRVLVGPRTPAQCLVALAAFHVDVLVAGQERAGTRRNVVLVSHLVEFLCSPAKQHWSHFSCVTSSSFNKDL